MGTTVIIFVVLAIAAWMLVPALLRFLVGTWRIWCPQALLSRYYRRKGRIQQEENAMYSQNFLLASRLAELLRQYQQRNDVRTLGAILAVVNTPGMTPAARDFVMDNMQEVHFSGDKARRVSAEDIFKYMPGASADKQPTQTARTPHSDNVKTWALLVAGIVALGITAILGITSCTTDLVAADPILNSVSSSSAADPSATVSIDARNAGKLEAGVIGQDGRFSFSVSGTINFGTKESNGPGGSSWHTCAEYDGDSPRPTIGTGAILFQVEDGPLLAVSELKHLEGGSYEIQGNPGQRVYCLINESPSGFADNTGTFNIYNN